mmetsp:Transcript_4418/g.6608  ORF Transcript_4418/g.6608 Transcript_4418/m.6608 type:complete len:259 (+) Transcript_4418:114-890(+)|eukprot:CAMPEP_0167747436 /NCGR_PEP_ID=MMETSP0110_2-20121227/4285_1 /TAXON_ID=629695 /ORGANISM="Gymnochlora sp., Strain CCMP2014" /LENGTH=258 /DNA_ID=CAMNT_0007632347 /DNA_START=53 /DNA_END=829 /DNA_ORIENTATION=+
MGPRALFRPAARHGIKYAFVLSGVALCVLSAASLSKTSSFDLSKTSIESSRRAAVRSLAGISLLSAIRVSKSNAFENRLKVKIDPFPKTPGPQPKDLGLRDDGSLKGCDFVKPNCFSTSPTPDDTEDLYASYLIPKFKFTKSKPEAFKDVVNVLESYEVGHDNIDGGGFKIIKADPKQGYIYVQYESLKKGYIDDFEMALGDDGQVQVRTASRLGFLDLRVNAKRVNYITDKLSQIPGWQAEKITPSTHPQYFQMNRV